MTARIVVIEDNERSSELIDILLRARGYVPLPATNGKDGMRIALLVRPDLILLDTDVIRLDIRMPGMDGDHVAAAIRNLPGLEHTRIVALTASTLSSERDRIAAAGFDGYICKPIDQKTFIDRVERFLSERPSCHDATADQS